jgi:hypothetical protein
VNRPQRSRANQRRRTPAKPSRPVDAWHAQRPLPELERIEPFDDPGALVRSLGDPPMHNGTNAGHYFVAVVERAAAVAAALALSAELLATPDDT